MNGRAIQENSLTTDYQALIDRIRDCKASDEVLDMMLLPLHYRQITALIGYEDDGWLVEMGASDRLKERCAAWRLMRRIASVLAIRQLLCEAWMQKTLDDVERNKLMWRLFDNHELPLELHRSLWNWIKGNRDSFVKAFMWYIDPFIHGQDNVYQGEGAINHLLAESISSDYHLHPSSKLWLYFAAAVLCTKGKEQSLNIRIFLNEKKIFVEGSIFDDIAGELSYNTGYGGNISIMKEKTQVKTAKPIACEAKSPLKLRAAKKLKAGEALKELVAKKRILPACETSSACSRPGR
jgi:hypothetical protein